MTANFHLGSMKRIFNVSKGMNNNATKDIVPVLPLEFCSIITS
jgi:hypothetical protein